MLDIHTVVDGRFRIDAVLGRGGYGVVYRATQLSIDRPVALKVLHASVADGADAIHRFRREARLTSRVVHPNVVRVIDFGDHDGDLYLVMELVDGPRLQDRIARGAALPVAEAARIGSQIATGLAAAHAEGLVHRDLKPGNVLLRQVDGRDQAVVIDFGLARLHDDAIDATDDLVTRSNVMLGTPAYMSPEVVSGAPLDGRSDLYALGVLLFRLVSGRLPFRGRTAIETATRHISAPRPALAAADGSVVPPALLQLVSRLLARDPAERPADAATVARDLARIADEADGLVSTDATAPTPLVDPHDDPRPQVADAVPDVVPAPTTHDAAPTAGLTPTAPTEPPTPPMAPSSGAGRGGPWILAGAALLLGAVAAAVIASGAGPNPAPTEPPSPVADDGPVAPEATPSTTAGEDPIAPLVASARAEVAVGLDRAAAGLELAVRGEALARETHAIARDALPPPLAAGPTPTGPGALSVQAVPWASVRLDGRDIGETPIERWPLEPGRYTVELRYQSEARDHTVRVRSGQTVVIDETFTPAD